MIRFLLFPLKSREEGAGMKRKVKIKAEKAEMKEMVGNSGKNFVSASIQKFERKKCR